MPDKFDPDERFKLDMEPEQAIRKVLGDKVPCPRCGAALVSEWDEHPNGVRFGTGVLLCPNCDYTSEDEG